MALALGASTAHAEDVPPPPSSPAAQAEARQAMERGIALRDAGDHEGALAEYKKAAIASWETYLRIKPNVQDATQIRARIDEIRSKHLEGIVDIECTPAGADVLLDPSELIGESHASRERSS